MLLLPHECSLMFFFYSTLDILNSFCLLHTKFRVRSVCSPFFTTFFCSLN